MINIEEDPLTKRLGQTRRKERWIRGRRGPSYHYSEIIFQGHPSPKESKMIEAMGKRPRKHPMNCLGCEGDHMYRYFPHIGEKVRTIHNVQQDDTVEDMGIFVPTIYAALDNKQVEFYSHMIEVEGKIKN
jgi:hypothetical protein